MYLYINSAKYKQTQSMYLYTNLAQYKQYNADTLKLCKIYARQLIGKETQRLYVYMQYAYTTNPR